MGKGKRSRENNSENIIQNSNTAAAAKNRTTAMTKIALIVIAVILVATLLLVFIQSSGIVLRVNTVYKTENFKFTGTMMQYMVNAQYQNFYANYGSYPSLFGLDTTKSLKEQAFNPSNYYISMFMGVSDEYKDFKGTWYDYFWAMASEQAKSALVFCEAAKKAGISLGEEEKKTIQESIDAIYKDMDSINEENRKYYEKNYGQKNYVTFDSVKEYLTVSYGNGVSISDIRNTLEILSLSEKYYNMKSEEILEALKNNKDKVEEYYYENISNYYKADYLSFTLNANYTAPTDSTKVESTWNTYLDNVNEALDHAKALSECTTEEEFKSYLIKYWFDESWQTQYDKTISDLKKKDNEDKTGKVLTDDDIPAKEVIEEKKNHVLEVITDAILNEKTVDDFEPTGDTAFDGAIDAIRDSLFESINKEYETLTIEMAEYDESTDAGKWLFDEERQAGDNKYFASHEATFKGGEPSAQADESTGEPEGEETPAGDSEEDKEPEEEKKPHNWEVKLDREKSEDAKFSVEVRFVLKTRYFVDDLVREFGHILLSEDTFLEEGDKSDAGKEAAKKKAKEEADKLLADFQKGDVTKESFEIVAKEKTEDSNVFYDEVMPGMMLESINDWLFSDDRKAGDMEVVESDYGYHLMYLVEISEDPSWLIEAREDLYADELEAWVEECEKTYAVNEKGDFAKNNLSFIA